MMHTRRDMTIGIAGVATMCAALGAVQLFGVALGAQAPAPPAAPPKLQFEVASVKINKGGDNRVLLGLQPGGRFTASNVPLRNLITNAYRIQSTQLVGGPSWLATERFDIVAKAEGDPTPEQINQMLQSLLADRFGLVAHRETREMPVYALMLARADGKLGDKIKPAAVDCDAVFAAGRGRGALPAPPTPGAPMSCGTRIGPGLLNAGGSTIDQLTNALGLNVGRIVQDKTGLTGRYDIELSWTPEQRGGAGGPGAIGGGPGGPPPSSDGSGVSIFTAIQEQLGLKLESQRAPLEVFVVDNATLPTPD